MDVEKITWRTRLCFAILLWIAEKLYDGTFPHQVGELAKEIKEEIKAHN